MKMKSIYSTFIISLILLNVGAHSKDNSINYFEFYKQNSTLPSSLKSIELNPHHITNNNYYSYSLPSKNLIEKISIRRNGTLILQEHYWSFFPPILNSVLSGI